jgi:hypothetical protein
MDGAEDFKLDPLAHRQPVELGQQWGGSRASRVLRHQAGSVVLENLQLVQLLCRGVCKQSIVTWHILKH